jgi:Fe2+ transport system protein B
MSVTKWKPSLTKALGIGAVSTAAASVVAENALAANAITDLFTAVDISGVQAAVYTFLVALVGVGLLFFGRRLLRSLGVSV